MIKTMSNPFQERLDWLNHFENLSELLAGPTFVVEILMGPLSITLTEPSVVRGQIFLTQT